MPHRLVNALTLLLFAILPDARAMAGPAGTERSASECMERFIMADVSAPTSQPEAEAAPRLVPVIDYSGNLWRRPALTGDWGGARNRLMNKGVRFDVSLIQVYQGNWSGGLKRDDPYQGNMRYGIQVDTGPAGLWPGGMFVIGGETRYGDSNNPYSGTISPVNTLGLYPQPGDDITCVTNLYAVQFVAPWLGFLAGKISPRDENVFASDETSQFLNASFNFNPIMGTTFPLDMLAAGTIVTPAPWLKVTTLALDSEGTASRTGFDTAFESGTSIYQQAAVSVKPFDLDGHQRLAWTWSDKSRIEMDQRIRTRTIDPERLRRVLQVVRRLPPRLRQALRSYARIQVANFLQALPDKVDRGSNDWTIMYDFDQYVYKVPGTKDQGFGFFGRFGVGPGDVNPIQTFYSIGIGGKGMIPHRDQDTFGIGYYCIVLSDQLIDTFNNLPRRLQPDLGNEHGVELYYNIAITNWLHLTPDLQIVRSALGRVETDVIGGLRLKMDF